MRIWIIHIALFSSAMAFGQISEPGMALIPSTYYQPLYTSTSDSAMIHVNSFWIDIYPVTNEYYLAFVRDHYEWSGSQVKPIFAEAPYLSHWVSDDAFEQGLSQSPVTSVSWFAARAYCKSRGKRLASVAEWEATALASETSPYGKDEEDYNVRILKWYSKPTPNQLPPVGSTFENYWGVFDMHGLIWEWVSDFNTALVTGESRGDSGLDRNLFCGSGSVGSADFEDYAAFMRFGFRSSLKAKYTITNLGFRCAKDYSSLEN